MPIKLLDAESDTLRQGVHCKTRLAQQSGFTLLAPRRLGEISTFAPLVRNQSVSQACTHTVPSIVQCTGSCLFMQLVGLCLLCS